MVHRGIVTGLASVVLIVLSAGCAGQRTGAAADPASPAAAVTASKLSGTWRGETWAIGTDSTSVLNRDVMLEIKDDATYRLTSTRMGTGTSNESGVAIVERNGVVLRNSTGQSTRLQRNGDKLYGVLTSGGRAMQIIVEKAR